MWHNTLSNWNNLVDVSVERPAQQRRARVWLWCALAVLVGSTYGGVVIVGQLQRGNGMFAGRPAGHQGVSPESSPVTLILATLVIVMACWIAWRPRWARTNSYQQQRGRIVASIGVALGIFVCATSVVLPLLAGELIMPLFGLVLVLITSQIVWLVRQGQVSLAGASLTGLVVTAALGLATEGQQIAVVANPMMSALAVLVSGLLVGWWCGLVAAVALPFASVALGAFGSDSASDVLPRLVPVLVVLLLFGSIVALYSRSLEAALRTADARAADLSAAEAALRGQNVALQHQTAELHTAQDRLRQTVAVQEQRITEAVAELRKRSVELSTIQTPLIRISRGVLVVPLVGAWDEQRSDAFTQALLHGIERQRARVAVLDLTGLTAMSEGVARMVLRIVTATRLLGCRCVLVGVQPESAQALVSLGIDLLGIETGADLADGVALSLKV